MYVIVWEFEPKGGREREFERVYAPDGDWAALFARSPEFRGTELLRPADGSRYLTVDRWSSAEAFNAFRDRWRADYEALDRTCEGLTAQETLIGRFDTA
ncbi:MAG: antibiotic biosynthesis monooxygenase family protein [Gemmatimonadales bacterium]